LPNGISTGVSATSYQQEQQQKLIDSNNQNNKNRILIVDDEKQHNKSLKLDLERNGFIVDKFTDPIVASENFKTGLFDMVDKKCQK
jgi:PleD family two-component response regulator